MTDAIEDSTEATHRSDAPAAAPETTEEIDATVHSWRVLGVGRAWSDAPTEAWGSASTLENGDELSITIGSIPDHVLTGIREYYVNAMFMLGALFGDGSTETEDEAAGRFWDESGTYVEELRGPYPTWITLEVRRNVRAVAASAAKYRWLRLGEGATVETLRSFEVEAADCLDVVLARLLPVLGENLRPERMLAGRRRAYVRARGRTTTGLPDFESSADAQVVTSGWNSLPLERISEAVAVAPDVSAVQAVAIRSAARWYAAALSEKKDPMRRFMFAFFGLEILANKFGKSVEKEFAESFADETLLPVRTLMWPSMRDSDAPARNLAFRFAIMAAVVARGTAVADVAEFAELAKHRNDLSHGSATDEDIKDLPAWPAIELLRRYLGAVAEYREPAPSTS